MVPPASLRLLAMGFWQTGRFALPSLVVVAGCAPCPVTIEFQTFREANLRYYLSSCFGRRIYTSKKSSGC
jgi:hypothetical protein